MRLNIRSSIKFLPLIFLAYSIISEHLFSYQVSLKEPSHRTDASLEDSMEDVFKSMVQDLEVALTGLQLTDFALPSFILLWFILLSLPLKGMDRRDPVAGSVYVLFMTSAGVTLMFAIPKAYLPDTTLRTQVLSVVSMGLVSGTRWVWANFRNPHNPKTKLEGVPGGQQD